MKYVVILALILGLVFAVSIDSAEAQLAGNKAFILSGNGFAVSSSKISDSSAEITFSTTQTKTKSEFTLQNGVIIVDQKDWNLSDFSGTILQNGKLFKFNAKATDSQGKQAIISAVGKLVDKTSTDSIYTINGVLTDSAKKTTKLVYTSKISEFAVKPTTSKTSDITIKILKGAANPQDTTYKTQITGFSFKFLSEDRITIAPGTTVTFVNEDDSSHSLESGTANYNSRKKFFTPDGKVSSGEIAPGESWSNTFDDKGFFRLFDEKYQHIDIIIFVIDSSKIQTNKPVN
jgi:plastocyanin